VVEEAGHGLQAIAVADDHKIGTADNRSTAFWCELPAEPDAIMMRVRITRPTKPMSRETFLNSADYRIDGSPAFALCHWIEKGGVFRPCTCNQRMTAVCVGLVPHRDKPIDQLCHIVHQRLHH